MAYLIICKDKENNLNLRLNNREKHLKYLESFKSNEDYIVKYTIPIFEEICKINNQNPYSSKAYEVIKNA